MSRSFHLETLHVGRLPGIDGAFTLPPLSPGLNVIFGPNASGKSSVLRAIEAALWPDAESHRDVNVTAMLRDGDDTWRIHRDAGTSAVTRNGVTASGLDMPAPALRHRYRLALHDLLAITETGGDFAAAIARASVGGLDLAAAADAAGFSEKPSRSMTLRNQLDAARSARRDAQQQQYALHREAAHLAELEARLETARSAIEAVEVWRAAERWAAARDSATSARTELAALPPAVSGLDGREKETAQAVCDDWRANRAMHERQLLLRDDARAAALGAFPQTAPDEAIRERWRALRDGWRAAHAAVFSVESALQEAVAREQELQRALGDVQPGRMHALSTAAVEEFAALAREAAEAHAERTLAERERQSLAVAAELVRPPGYPDQIREAIRLLTRWLAAANAPELATPELATPERSPPAEPAAATGNTPSAAFWLLLLVGVVGWGLAAVTWHATAWAGVLLMLLLAWWHWRRLTAELQRATAAAREAEHAAASTAASTARQAALQRLERERRSLEGEYAVLEAPDPEQWTPDRVRAQLSTLTRELVQCELNLQRTNAGRAAATRLEQAEQRIVALQDRREQLVHAHGVAPRLEGETLLWFVERLTRWHDAHASRLATAAQLEAATVRASELLAAFASLCASFGESFGEPRSESPAEARPADAAARSATDTAVAEAEAMVALLERRFEAHREARRALETAERELARLQEVAASLQRSWTTLFARAGLSAVPLPETLDAEGEQRVREALAALDAVVRHQPTSAALTRRLEDAERDMTQAVQVATEARARHGRGVGEHPETAWAALSMEAVRAALAEAEAQAATHRALVEELAALRHRLDTAGTSDAVERALELVESAEAAMAAQYAGNVHAMVGHALMEHVRSVARDVDRPRVFHRAKALFARITRGEWQLQLDDASDRDAVFLAVESRTGRPVPLANLSGGTRVQLLVAVRVAFVENEEQGWKLPLLLDETLGTTDDVRARAFMDAMLALAEEGRQLFYCTAQRDEVDYWRGALAERASAGRAVSCTEIDMAAVRAIALAGDGWTKRATTRAGSLDRAEGAPVLPVQGYSHASYGEMLSVPPLDLGRTPVGATHLWYVFTALDILHAALSLGISHWGALEHFLAQGGTLHVPGRDAGDVERTLACAAALAQAVAVMHREAAIGLGATVTRSALSGAALSERQREAIGALAEECQGDAAELLRRLADRAVSGFGETRVAGFRDWLLDAGLLDERAPRTAAEIRLSMLAQRDGVLDHSDIEALLARVAARARATGTNADQSAD